MRLHCHDCGKSVSTEVPDDTILRAVAICPECVITNETEPKEEEVATTQHLLDSFKKDGS
jgi:hypothetical protein